MRRDVAGFRLGPPAIRYLCTVRGETRIPSVSFNSLAMCYSPYLGLSEAILRINSWRSLGNRGRPTVLDLQRQQMESLAMPSDAPVRFHIHRLLGTKLRALFQRKKGRDLFDLGVALEDESLDVDGVIACFEKYMAHGGAAVSRAQFEENLRAKLGTPEFTADLPVILSADALAAFDVQRVGTWC